VTSRNLARTWNARCCLSASRAESVLETTLCRTLIVRSTSCRLPLDRGSLSVVVVSVSLSRYDGPRVLEGRRCQRVPVEVRWTEGRSACPSRGTMDRGSLSVAVVSASQSRYDGPRVLECRRGQRVPVEVRQHVGVQGALNDPLTDLVRIRTDYVQHLHPDK